RGIGPDKGVVTDDRLFLVHPVIVAGDGPCPDIGARADLGVAEIAQMARLGALTDPRLLHFNEVPEMHVGPEFRATTNAGEGTNAAALADHHILDVAKGPDLD